MSLCQYHRETTTSWQTEYEIRSDCRNYEVTWRMYDQIEKETRLLLRFCHLFSSVGKLIRLIKRDIYKGVVTVYSQCILQYNLCTFCFIHIFFSWNKWKVFILCQYCSIVWPHILLNDFHQCCLTMSPSFSYFDNSILKKVCFRTLQGRKNAFAMSLKGLTPSMLVVMSPCLLQHSVEEIWSFTYCKRKYNLKIKLEQYWILLFQQKNICHY